MGNKLDAIRIYEMISDPTTVNTDYVTERVLISDREDAFSVQIVFDNGSSVDMNLNLQYSVDGINFATGSTQQITDTDGSHIFDVEDSGAQYIRIEVEVISGSVDFQRMVYSGRRRH